MPKNELICISCPIGCHLTLTETSDNKLQIKGNKCARGIEYAQAEYYSPKRIVTATCHIQSELTSRLPLKTDQAFPREKINALLTDIYKLKLKAPIKLGDVIIENIEKTGINLVATLSVTQ
jgi:CxxC motif-containing protein